MKFFWSQQTLHKLPKFVMIQVLFWQVEQDQIKKGVADCNELGKLCAKSSTLCGR